MRILLTESFQRDVGYLSQEERLQLFNVLMKTPQALKDTHAHSGLGLRKIHASGIFEARIGLGLRMVFGFEKSTLIFHRVADHDEIRRYLRNL